VNTSNIVHTRNETYGRVALLGLASLAGEDDKAGLVLLQPLNIDLLALLAQVRPPVVDDNSNALGLLPADTGLLQLGEGESTALTNFAVVAHGLGADGGAEEGEGANAEGSGLGLAGLATAELAAWLVEPGADTALPVLAEVVLVEDWLEVRLEGTRS
jgi:hypothetical protein